MELDIYAGLQWGNLLGGDIKWPMACRLGLNGTAQLIHVELVQKSTPLDLLQLLNQSFGLDLPQDHWLVEQSGFFYYHNSDESVSMEQCFPSLPLPTDICQMSQAETICLWLTMDVQQLGCAAGLLDFQETTTLSLIAVLGRNQTTLDALRHAELQMKLDNLVLLPTLRQDDQPVLVLQQATLHLWMRQTTQFRVEATFHFHLLDHDFSLQGHVQRTDTMLSGGLDGVQCQKDNPVTASELRGLQFLQLKFAFEKALGGPNSPLWFLANGTVAYGTLECSGMLATLDWSLFMAWIKLNQDLSISKIFAVSLPDVPFPQDLFDLKIRAGSMLCYRSAQSVAAGQWPESLQDMQNIPSGFYMSCAVELVIRKPFVFQGFLAVGDTGITGSIALQDGVVDLYVIQLSDLRLVLSEVQDQPQRFGLGCTLSLLHEPCCQIELALQRETDSQDLLLRGTFTACQAMKDFLHWQDDLSLTFSYSKTSGFHLLNWPTFPFDGEGVDLVKALQQVIDRKNSGSCRRVTELVSGSLVKSSFHLSPKFHAGEEGNGITLELNGTYTFTTGSREIVTLEFPSVISATIPCDLHWNTLGKVLEDTLQSAAESLAESLLLEENHKNLLELLAILAGEKAAELGIKLVCRGIINRLEAAALAAGGTAAGAVIGCGGAGLDTGIAAGAAAAAIGWIIDSGSAPEQDDLSAPGDLQAVWQGDAIFVSWIKVHGATGYDIFLLDDRGYYVTEQKTNAVDMAVFSMETKTPQPGYQVRICPMANRCYGSKNAVCKVEVKPSPPPQPTPPEPDPPQPDPPQITVTGTRLQLHWQAVPDVEYVYRVLAADGSLLVQETARQSPVTVTITTAWGLGLLTVQLAIRQEDRTGPWSQGTPFLLDGADLAQRARAEQQDGSACAALLANASPQSPPEAIAWWMAQAGYDAKETAQGLQSQWPQLPVKELLQVVTAAYGGIVLPEQIAETSRQQGLSGAECARAMREAAPYMGPSRAAVLMARAGYGAEAITEAITVLCPTMDRDTILAILSALYKEME